MLADAYGDAVLSRDRVFLSDTKDLLKVVMNIEDEQHVGGFHAPQKLTIQFRKQMISYLKINH